MVPKLLDIVGIPLLKPLPRGHQTENHVIGKSSLWAKVGALPWRGLEDICDRPASLWMNGSQTKTGGLNNCISSAGAAALRTSLALVKPERFSVEVGSKTWDGKTTKTYWAISTTTASATF
jgi:hypothetical protein